MRMPDLPQTGSWMPKIISAAQFIEPMLLLRTAPWVLALGILMKREAPRGGKHV